MSEGMYGLKFGDLQACSQTLAASLAAEHANAL
jgi:hypothetical protein